MSRLDPLSPDILDPTTRAAYDQIVADSGPLPAPDREAIYGEATRKNRARIAGPFNIWLRCPGIAKPATDIANYFHFRGRLSPRNTELVILLAARHFGAPFAWATYEEYARTAGLSDDAIAAIAAGRSVDDESGMADDDRAVWKFTTTLLENKRVDEDTYGATVEVLGEGGTVELVSLIGFYAMIAFSLNAFEVAAPQGSAVPF